ncbi:hypothetical protein THAOC_33566 [Thalassiosira oceanica]|uniref:RING-type domain-containing protein n=1 Tax=Thalassiosira oceanica TaxID=159749 RepID=K0R405_THAOC|nr:hypothetical protein THAOC_33566 [Thalassiosira oceanica]|eukprot:EJK47698.1 hypothetical protein THAOC_33566 [Thalassiosira oceanica]
MRGVRGSGKEAGADEDGPHEVGGGRLPNLPVAIAAWSRQSTFRMCCMKKVCNGCILAAGKRGMRDCPFCRSSVPDESQALAMIRKRVAADDPQAIFFLGAKYRFRAFGLDKYVTRAVELYERAAQLGVTDAHFNLGVLYTRGTDVEKDMAKAIRHYEAAAMCGHHWMISAKLGCQDSLNTVKRMFMNGHATKADYAAALRGYQSAIEDMSSPDRDEARAMSTVGRTLLKRVHSIRLRHLPTRASPSGPERGWRLEASPCGYLPSSRYWHEGGPTVPLLWTSRGLAALFLSPDNPASFTSSVEGRIGVEIASPSPGRG